MSISKLGNDLNLALEQGNYGKLALVAEEAVARLEAQPEPVELEAVHVGLTPDQEIRHHGLRLAVDLATADNIAYAGRPSDYAMSVARDFAAWIADGDPASAHSTASEGTGSAVEPRTGLGEGDRHSEGPEGESGALPPRDCPTCGRPATGYQSRTVDRDDDTGTFIRRELIGIELAHDGTAATPPPLTGRPTLDLGAAVEAGGRAIADAQSVPNEGTPDLYAAAAIVAAVPHMLRAVADLLDAGSGEEYDYGPLASPRLRALAEEIAGGGQ